jgi:hypothetical protein
MTVARLNPKLSNFRKVPSPRFERVFENSGVGVDLTDSDSNSAISRFARCVWRDDCRVNFINHNVRIAITIRMSKSTAIEDQLVFRIANLRCVESVRLGGRSNIVGDCRKSLHTRGNPVAIESRNIAESPQWRGQFGQWLAIFIAECSAGHRFEMTVSIVAIQYVGSLFSTSWGPPAAE